VRVAPIRAFAYRFGIALLACAVVVTAALFAINRYIDHEVAKIPRVDVAMTPSSGSAENFLVVGSDSRAFVGDNPAANEAFGNTGDSGPPKSDTLMVLHANGDQSYAVSFPRDLWVDIPGKGKAKINSALNDGPQKVVDTLKSNFDLDINHYVQVDFQSFQTLVDAIGGISVWVPHASRSDPNAEGGGGGSGFAVIGAGCWPLNGQQALAYVRARAPFYQYLINGKWVQADPIPDIGRIQRQQAFVKKLGRLTIAKVTDDPVSAPGLADKVIPDLTVDRSFDRTAFNALAQAFLDSNGGTGIAFDTMPWSSGRANDQSVLYVKQPEADTVLARLRGTAPIPSSTSAGPAASSTPSVPALRPADVRVRVLNASGVQGAAGDAETALGKLGFVNGGVANDPRGTIDHSEVRYRPGDEAKAQLVAASLPGVQLVADSTLPGTDVVVALGRNFTGVTPTTVPNPASPTTSVAPAAAAQAACDAS
jgi:LCP family protein required for cell wall assembly